MMKVLLLMSVMTSIVSLQVKIQDLIPVLEPAKNDELLSLLPALQASASASKYANSTTQEGIFLQQQAGAGRAQGPYEQISRGKDFCRGKELWKGATSGQSDCEHKCTANGQCKFYSFWFTGGLNYCALVTDCDSYSQQNHDIVIMKKRPIWDCDKMVRYAWPKDNAPWYLANKDWKKSSVGGVKVSKNVPNDKACGDWCKEEKDCQGAFFRMSGNSCMLYRNTMDVFENAGGDSSSMQRCTRHDSIFTILTDIKKSIKNELESDTNTAAKECTSDTKATLEVVEAEHEDGEWKGYRYKDLTGCAKGSECETSTEAQQKLLVVAGKKMTIRTIENKKLSTELESLQKQEKAKKEEKARLEKEIVDDGKLHKARMEKFTRAITSLTKINDHLINTGEIKMPTLLEEEKNVIGNFKVGKVMLLMLDQAASGVKEKELVNTLKKLLTSCINSLEDSKKVEKEKHANWVKLKESKIKALEAVIKDLIAQKGVKAAKITANDKIIASETIKYGNAMKTHKTESDSCMKLHTNFVDSVKEYNSEIDAVDKMIDILNDAKLNADTQTIRDETEETKHGVKESVEQGVTCWSNTGEALTCGDGSAHSISTNNGWFNCNDFGGRLKCPSHWPYMCASKTNTDNMGVSDFWCKQTAADCDGHGGLRPCDPTATAATTAAPAVSKTAAPAVSKVKHKVCHKDNCKGTLTNPIPRGEQWTNIGKASDSGCCALWTGQCDFCEAPN